ncbi:hypothetical protein PPL_09224 [Heterostelium album PN500]|uniref:C2H2-type domain-containing protein n=1 Tax=Heterostelium pallidum (strain ATCC 26659 / Pp 5 / PN500) TaxID=670386 RepID=D3BKZ2_HETP5|nr:hypothetical protein PPL_09224 [Heterostelium album PN500]EFA78572.1 hypothetical protein PPL_09224 [Heterostelium album PN500]|eukprot:XP_020430696.1 hypothetical protein PPL_09224 [Heterostelium album PN500]
MAKQHQCPQCPKTFKTAKALRLHSATHVPIDERYNFPCTYEGCLRVYTKKSNLDSHIKQFHIGEEWICKHLIPLKDKVKSKSKSKSKSSTLAETPTTAEGSSDKAEEMIKDENELVECGQVFMSKTAWKRHTLNLHNGQPKIRQPKKSKVDKVYDALVGSKVPFSDKQHSYFNNNKSYLFLSKWGGGLIEAFNQK